MANCTTLPLPPGPAPSGCAFSFGAPTHLSFDLSAHAATYQQCYPASASDYFAYALALCGALPQAATAPACDAGASSAQQYLDGTCFHSLGAWANASAAVLETGLALTLPSTTQCSSGGGGGGGSSVLFTVLTLTCAPELPRGALAVDAVGPVLGSEGCGTAYAARSAAACGRVVPRLVPTLGITAAVLLGLGLAAALYCLGGVLYNRRARGARGLEAVPHIAALRAGAAGLAWALGLATCGRCGGGEPERGAEYDELKASEELMGDAYFTVN